MIVILCGLPGAGKTTLATRLVDRLAARGHAVALHHADDYDSRTYDRLYEDVAAANEGQATGHWVLDGTFARREWRNRFYRLDDVREVWVRADLETCLARNRERGDPVPEQGLVSIYGDFERPRADLTVDTEALDVEEAVDRLTTAVLTWLE